jgi:drug/metabolite transporter (DMT)-like permease
MSNLVLTIVFTSWLLIAFRVFDLYKIDHLQGIIFNYIVCALIGFFLFHNYEKILEINSFDTWILFALITGTCFMPTFYLMAYTVKNVSVTVSTIASKISLIIPVSVSLLYLNKEISFTWLNIAGLFLGLGAILMSSIKKNTEPSSVSVQNRFLYFLPALVFLGGGLVDVLINITNFNYLPKDKSSLFPFFAFSAAALSGLFVLVIRMILFKEKLKIRNLVGGIVLGIPNYLSIFFLLRALQDFENNGALIFPVLNICVILVNSIVAILFFKEKLSRYNYAGLFLAIVSLMLIISS